MSLLRRLTIFTAVIIQHAVFRRGGVAKLKAQKAEAISLGAVGYENAFSSTSGV